MDSYFINNLCTETLAFTINKKRKLEQNQMIDWSIKSQLTIMYLNLNTIHSARKSHQGLSITPLKYKSCNIWIH